jgi:hypothetical protein
VTDDLYRLVYFSRNRIAGSHADIDLAVQDILSKARSKNAKLGITGALMFNSGCFIQTLEGPQWPVKDIFHRIKTDPRNGAVTVLSSGTISERSFAHWSMAFVGTDKSDLARHGGIAEESGFDPSRMSGDAVSEFLHRLLLKEEQETGFSV